MAEFDTVAKHLIQTHPADFARFVLQRDDIQAVEVLDTEQPNVRRPDSLLQVRVGDQDVLVHHEFQTTDSTDTPMPRRMAGYIGRLLERYGLPVYAHVLYLRPNAGRRDPGYYLQEHPNYSVVIRYKVIRLRQLRESSRARQRVNGLVAVCAPDAAVRPDRQRPYGWSSV